MTFEQITENEKLWAVRYDDCLDNVLDSILGQWNDVVWLRDFFKSNFEDLASYFKITDVNQAIYDTIEDSEKLDNIKEQAEDVQGKSLYVSADHSYFSTHTLIPPHNRDSLIHTIQLNKNKNLVS